MPVSIHLLLLLNHSNDDDDDDNVKIYGFFFSALDAILGLVGVETYVTNAK